MTETTIIEKNKSTGDANARIAVAIRFLFEKCTAVFSLALSRAFESGLNRESIDFSEHGSLFRPGFCVDTFTVSWHARAAAIQSVKATLNDLGLSGMAVIATVTADDIWKTLYGIEFADVSFGQEFLNPEDFRACQAEMDDLRKRTEAFTECLAHLKQSISPGPNPESK